MTNKNEFTEQQLKAQKFANALYNLEHKQMSEVREEFKRLLGLAVADGATYQTTEHGLMSECGEVLAIKYQGEIFYVGEVKFVNIYPENMGMFTCYYDEESVFCTQAEREQRSWDEIQAERRNEEALYGYEMQIH